jgi:hypothetical protein
MEAAGIPQQAIVQAAAELELSGVVSNQPLQSPSSVGGGPGQGTALPLPPVCSRRPVIESLFEPQSHGLDPAFRLTDYTELRG